MVDYQTTIVPSNYLAVSDLGLAVIDFIGLEGVDDKVVSSIITNEVGKHRQLIVTVVIDMGSKEVG